MAPCVFENNLHISVDHKAQIYRYRSYCNFVKILKDSSLWFSRLDIMAETGNDKKEGKPTKNAYDDMINRSYKKWIKNGFKIENGIEWKEKYSLDENIKRQIKATYINCWCQNNSEDYLLWNRYAKNGVAIKSTPQKLCDSLRVDSRVIIKPRRVIYGDPYSSIDFLEFINWKDSEYKSEKEIRFITQREYPYSKHPKGIPIKIDLKELCEKIIIAPGSKQCMIKKIKNKLKKYCADDIEVARSSLDIRPNRI